MKKNSFRVYTVLALALLMAVCLAGCGGQTVPTATTTPAEPTEEAPAAETPTPAQSETPQETEPPAPTPEPEPEPEETAPLHNEGGIPVGEGSGFTDFDSALLVFLEEQGYARESFLVSPLSFRMALALAAEGAGNETKSVLLSAMGFEDGGAMADWVASVNQGVAAFQSRLDRELQWYAQYPDDFGGIAPDRAYRVANSIWHNADREGDFLPTYQQLAQERFNASAANLPGEELSEAVNGWVNEETDGMIPKIVGDLSDTDAVLVNALYFRSTWSSTFDPADTLTMDFHTPEEETVEKEFMCRQGNMGYYADEETQLVVLPLAGSMSAAFVLGDTTEISTKLSAASYQEVLVRLPKLELETSLENGELTAFLEARGAGLALSEDADFSRMSETPWRIQDIIQKARVKTDEDGLEAAAATAIMVDGTAVQEPQEPVEFTADRPFAFYIYSTYADRPELLFFGQYLR